MIIFAEPLLIVEQESIIEEEVNRIVRKSEVLLATREQTSNRDAWKTSACICLIRILIAYIDCHITDIFT